MKQLLFFCLLALSFRGQAQCNVHSKKDEYTGKGSRWTDKIKVARGGTPAALKASWSQRCTYVLHMMFAEIDGTITLVVFEDADQCFCYPNIVGIKFADDSALVKNNARAATSATSARGEEQKVFFPITMDELRMFARKRITKMRFTEKNCPDHVKVEDELSDKTAAELQEAAVCLVEAISRR